MPYPSHLAATLSGASLRQLQWWRESKLLEPEFGMSSGRLMYSFRDVVALRTFVYLRDMHSLQQVRAAIGTLRDLGNLGHLATYSIGSDGDDIVLLDEQDVMSLRRRPGHMKIAAVMADVITKPFQNVQGARVVRLDKPRPKLSVDPETLGGYPVIEATRIEYDLVAGLVADGVKPSDVGHFYRGVTAAAALDAARFSDLVERYRDGEVPSAA